MNEVSLKFFVVDADNKIMEKKKEITAYQINNVLRVYGDQLRRGKISNRYNEFIFKKIEGNGETINSISIKDSKFLTNKLKLKKRIR